MSHFDYSDSPLSIRQTLAAKAGEGPLVDAAGVAANFQRMVRFADSTGIPMDRQPMDSRLRRSDELNSPRSPAPSTPSYY